MVDVLRTGAVPQVHLNNRSAGWVPQQVGAGSSVTGLSFADSRLRLADMTGDGLTDIVLVSGGQVRYWPNLGYGRFGPPVVLRGHLDLAGATPASGLDQRRLLLGDVNGDGCADLVYVGPGWVKVWVNRCGQSLGPGVLVRGTPTVDDSAAVRLTDMIGTGTAGVLWSFDSSRAGRMSFLDLTGGVKPYLLTSIDNHAGTRTEISYETSVQHASRDAAAGRLWRGTLPFPVQVVGAVTTVDSVSASRLSTVYAYHHGHWDGAEREFRGFGRVDRYDTQQFDRQGDLPAESYTPPALTRTWFHQGPVGPEAGDWQELDFSGEYWPGDPDLLGPGDRSTLPAGLDRRARREVARGLAGRVLRTEVYGLDGSSRADRPYTVTEHRWDVRAVGDPAAESWSRAPVVTVVESANRTTTWERGDDPHTRVTFHSGFDTYGRVRRSAGVAVARGRDPRLPGPGEPPLCTVSTVEYATRDDATGYRIDLTARAAGYEVFSDGSHTLAELERALAADALPRRLRTYARNGYDGEPYVGLPSGQFGEHGLLTSTTTLALTAGILGRDLGLADVPPYLRPPTPAHGLRGEYFRDGNLGTPAFVRPDPTVDFTWFGGPDPALAQPEFSVRWTGTLTPAVSGTYTFDVQAAGPVRLWLGDHLLVDTWSDGPGGLPPGSDEAPDDPRTPLPTSLVALPPGGPIGPPVEDPVELPTGAAVALSAGVGYPLRLDCRADGWAAGVRLRWSPDGQESVPVPTGALTPPAETADWSPRHPQAFRDTVPDLAGYRYQAGDTGDPAGYYVVTGARFDVHDDPAGRGLTVATRDALGHETRVTHDAFAMLPVAVTDPAGLVRTARYDYRLFKPDEVVDVNGNRSRVGYTPLGLVGWTAALGRAGAREGDTVEQPSAVFHYGLTAWEDSPPQARQPSWVHSVRRTEHRWTLIATADAARAAAGQPPLTDTEVAAMFPADEATRHPERFVATRTYCDGSGRPVQARTQGDDLVVDDLGLPAEPGARPGR
ncbi:toxin TcdB middle/N-terminal domain-containing protein [Micromonospora sp. ATA51]|uniref:toxin TcdB middle/N-terminal domain-containing protein n=1 Tax=Micromonospora sp. ATA51 TaxID=2806098 RepID=UPI001A496FCE|nr:toxin TcdB middle/N-terminal domain-containing protein [Micromonospora sp. ATA51]MBM0227216.1 VCBS repeat-containing protein [Micromonospora sp. ATA51]